MARSKLERVQVGTSLVVQWLRICLAKQGMQARSLVAELGSHMLRRNEACAPQLESLCTTTKDPAWHNKDMLQLKLTQPNKYVSIKIIIIIIKRQQGNSADSIISQVKHVSGANDTCLLKDQTDLHFSASYYPSSSLITSTSHPSTWVHIKDLEIKSDWLMVFQP